MQEPTARQTGSPYNPQNNPDADMIELSTPVADNSGLLSERLTHAAVEDLGFKRAWVDFPTMLSPERRDDGSLVVTDERGLLEYDLKTGELRTTRKFEEMVEVVDHNQHAATNLDQMILG